jgi:hypothetical protein
MISLNRNEMLFLINKTAGLQFRVVNSPAGNTARIGM